MELARTPYAATGVERQWILIELAGSRKHWRNSASRRVNRRGRQRVSPSLRGCLVAWAIGAKGHRCW